MNESLPRFHRAGCESRVGGMAPSSWEPLVAHGICSTFRSRAERAHGGGAV